MAANNPWEMSWKEDTTATTSEQGSSPWTINWQEEKAKPTKKLSAIEQIRTGNFPAAERFRAGYAQMPEYLQDPYLGLSTSNIGKVGAEMFPGVTKFISQTIPERLMQSALKPTQKQLESGKAATAVKTMLEEYQKENGTLDDKEYEKLFVHFYLENEDEYLKKRIKSIRSDGKKRV